MQSFLSEKFFKDFFTKSVDGILCEKIMVNCIALVDFLSLTIAFDLDIYGGLFLGLYWIGSFLLLRPLSQLNSASVPLFEMLRVSSYP